MLQRHIFAYADTHRYRIGTNYAHLPINRLLVQADNYQRDGAMSFTANGGGSANYEPNSVNGNGPKEAPEYAQQAFAVSGTSAHTHMSATRMTMILFKPEICTAS
jgi:catalase